MNTDRAIALEELERLSEFDQEPVLDSATVGKILDKHQTAVLWAPATVYKFGHVVVPTETHMNGRKYRCVKAGTSASTEPEWPDANGWRVTDGGTLRWEEYGPAGNNLWNIDAAASECWQQKIALVTQDFDFSSGTNASYKRSQVYEHCVDMANRFNVPEFF